MSKNEKRILVVEVNPDCKAFHFDCGDPFDEEDRLYCNKNGRYVRITEKNCKKCKSPVLAGITRAEAVEKMAKAVCKSRKVSVFCKRCSKCELWTNFKGQAEAALDALFGKESENGK